MRILLVNPPKSEGKFCLREECCSGVNEFAFLPAQLAQIGGILKDAGHQARIIDLNVGGSLEEVDFDHDVVVSSAMIVNLGNDLKVLKMAKARGLTTISIVNDPLYPEEIMKRYDFIDFFVREEREYVVPQLIDALASKKSPEGVKGLYMRKDGNVISTGRQCPVELDFWTMPMYEELPLEKYEEAIVLAGKGCNYNCGFCFYASTNHRYKQLDLLIQEIALLKDYPYRKFYIYDLNFTTTKAYVRAFCERLISEGISIKWVCDGRVNEVDEELLWLMKKSGCIQIVYGIESGSDRILTKIRKGFKASDAMEKIAMTAQAGINPYPCFIIGYPWETREDLEQTERFIRKIVPRHTNVVGLGFLNPAPGSQIYQYLVSKELAHSMGLDSFVRFGADMGSWDTMPFAPTEHLSVQELIKTRKRILRRALLQKTVSGQAIGQFMAMPFRKKLSFLRTAASQVIGN